MPGDCWAYVVVGSRLMEGSHVYAVTSVERNQAVPCPDPYADAEYERGVWHSHPRNHGFVDRFVSVRPICGLTIKMEREADGGVYTGEVTAHPLWEIEPCGFTLVHGSNQDQEGQDSDRGSVLGQGHI